MWTTFTQKVRRAFSEAADQYDILTSLHKEIGRELVKKNVKLNAQTILDVGCGTGYVANKAKFFFPESRIIGLDLAEGMLAQAKTLHEGIPIDWLQADACQLPFKNATFDLIMSNLAYQWAGDLDAAFREVRRCLAPNGKLNATLFGSRTFEELLSCLQVVNPALKLRRLPSLKKVQESLEQAGFSRSKTDYELIKVQFKDVMELIVWLKSIGANNLGEDNFFLGKQMLAKADEYYKEKFPYHDGIAVSFEVIWVDAQ